MAVDASRRGRSERHAVARPTAQPPPEQTPAAEPSRRLPVAHVLAQAREMIAADERLDMARLSAELGVDRTTLFRWVGNRDQLLAEVVWSIVEPLFRDCAGAAEGSGASYIARVLGRWVVAAHRSPELRAVLARDQERALRLLAGRDGAVYRRLVAAVEKLLRTERATGNLPHPLAVPELAELVVRMANVWTWTEMITGEPPDPAGAQVAIGLLLRPQPTKP